MLFNDMKWSELMNKRFTDLDKIVEKILVLDLLQSQFTLLLFLFRNGPPPPLINVGRHDKACET